MSPPTSPRLPTRSSWPIVAVLVAAGCAVGSDEGFSSFGPPPNTTAPSTAGNTSQTSTGGADSGATSAGDASGSSGGTGVSATESAGSSGATTEQGGSTTGDGSSSSSSSSGSSSSSSGGNSSSSSSSSTGGGQPADGMYSSCDLTPNECDAQTPVCLQLGNADPNGDRCNDFNPCPMGQGCFNNQCGPVSDAFCTIDTCMNPAGDCDPSPGGTATPICLPGGGGSFCALDCSNGKTCPTGMTCYNVGVTMICA